ncbi:hypothetical protein CWI38_0187p0010 [Hamiltosporidium tvaerminnensis]|uniref:Uncharacterized protein n=1 Tax=Hamiltosporidium tvaerminnensis TaxID=1176355 RepID=A0A4V2JY60_9MICR|nr:hypothetical protein CWI38_0187p0010 [Hamiltosporidium tvaerminnensis]
MNKDMKIHSFKSLLKIFPLVFILSCFFNAINNLNFIQILNPFRTFPIRIIISSIFYMTYQHFLNTTVPTFSYKNVYFVTQLTLLFISHLFYIPPYILKENIFYTIILISISTPLHHVSFSLIYTQNIGLFKYLQKERKRIVMVTVRNTKILFISFFTLTFIISVYNSLIYISLIFLIIFFMNLHFYITNTLYIYTYSLFNKSLLSPLSISYISNPITQIRRFYFNQYLQQSLTYNNVYLSSKISENIILFYKIELQKCITLLSNLKNVSNNFNMSKYTLIPLVIKKENKIFEKNNSLKESKDMVFIKKVRKWNFFNIFVEYVKYRIQLHFILQEYNGCIFYLKESLVYFKKMRKEKDPFGLVDVFIKDVKNSMSVFFETGVAVQEEIKINLSVSVLFKDYEMV